MQLGMVGLGRMGANMTRRLVRGRHYLVVSDLSPDAVKQLAGEGAVASSSLEDLVGKLKDTPEGAGHLLDNTVLVGIGDHAGVAQSRTLDRVLAGVAEVRAGCDHAGDAAVALVGCEDADRR